MSMQNRVVSEPELDMVHTGPGTLAGRYLRRFWLPVYRAEDLVPGQAHPLLIMSEDYTLYRSEDGQPHLLASRCAHRGAQLASGWVEGNYVRCRYHGWVYDGTGQCVEQPGEDEEFAAKIRIRAYPARDYLGLIFAYLGEGEPPVFQDFPDYQRPGVLTAMPPETWPCNYFNRLDNDPDGFHVQYTHQESIGRAGRAAIYVGRKPSSEETDYGAVTSIASPVTDTEYLHSFMPNANQIRVKTGMTSGGIVRQVWEHRLTWSVPITDDSSLRFEVDYVPLEGEEAETYRARHRLEHAAPVDAGVLGEAVLSGKLRIADIDPSVSTYELFRVEDYVTEVGQGRIADRSQDRLGRIDVGVILRRRLWQRELRALAEGTPLKEWMVPANLMNLA